VKCPISWRRSFACAALTATSIAGMAQDIPGYPKDVYAADPREMAMIPSYCRYTLLFRDSLPATNKMEMFEAWKATIGEGYGHMHHYCAGLIKANRATLLARDRTTRQFLLNDAIVEYDYVITRVPETYVLLPEMLTKKGEALVQLDKGPLGIYFFQRAIEIKPDYWPPYAQLSDYHQRVGELKKAREILEAGLAAVPGTQALTRRLEALGGKP
jgi:tetratricopeptide (TPR) repeat protein